MPHPFSTIIIKMSKYGSCLTHHHLIITDKFVSDQLTCHLTHHLLKRFEVTIHS